VAPTDNRLAIMAGLLIIAHAPLASALREVARHAFPDCASQVAAFDVDPGMSAEAAYAGASALLQPFGQSETLILADVFGATPCNVAQRLSDGVRVKVVAGVNVPMLWRALCYSSEPIDALVARALAGATQGAMQASPARPQQQARSAENDDAKNQRDHHQ
jgi:mannose PTS system EIIA component